MLIVSLFATHQLIDFGLRKIKTSKYGVLNAVVGGTVNADIVISGSSRALTHYDTRILSRELNRTVFNIGRNGSQTDMQLAFLKTYLLKNKKPQIIIHNLDLFSFDRSLEIYDIAQYLPYLREMPLMAEISRIYPDDAWKFRLLPLYGYAVYDTRFTWMLALRGLLNLQPVEDCFNGFQPRFQGWTGDFDKFRSANPNGVKFHIDPAGQQSLAELAALCRSEGIELIFVYSPVYRGMQNLEMNREEIFAEFLRISDKYYATLWDYSSDIICDNKENFYNSQHLNQQGAAQFSSKLAGRLRSHILEKSVPQVTNGS